jgi:hypothetical protein
MPGPGSAQRLRSATGRSATGRSATGGSDSVNRLLFCGQDPELVWFGRWGGEWEVVMALGGRKALDKLRSGVGFRGGREYYGSGVRTDTGTIHSTPRGEPTPTVSTGGGRESEEPVGQAFGEFVEAGAGAASVAADLPVVEERRAASRPPAGSWSTPPGRCFGGRRSRGGVWSIIAPPHWRLLLSGNLAMP